MNTIGIRHEDKYKFERRTPNIPNHVKELTENEGISFFVEGKTYVFFSHVIKGQPYKIPMLKKLMKKKATLIDYEKIEDSDGRRLLFFGRFAGQRFFSNGLKA